MRIRVGVFIREQTIRNLLHAHERIIETGDVPSILRLSKFILKLSKQFDNQLLDFGAEKCHECAEHPPEEC